MTKPGYNVQGQVVDIDNKSIFPGEISIIEGKIHSVSKLPSAPEQYIMPGFIDAHIHIESSLLVPSEFARIAVVHGTVATVSDPHEIGNVLGVDGVNYMIENSRLVNFKFYFGAPSCVPATPFETAGATIDSKSVRNLLARDEIKYLSEMMNWPGVLNQDPVVMEKIASAQKLGLPVDGHAPGLSGQQAIDYISAGISTDHECFTESEALGKLKAGMKILVREGSAARNFEALVNLLHDYADNMMFCSDDKHPDILVKGHINELARRAVGNGVDLFKVLRVACKNPVQHYGLDVGQLHVGDPADFVIVDSLESFNVIATYINGKLVAENGNSLIPRTDTPIVNQFMATPRAISDFEVVAKSERINVIEALDGELITNNISATASLESGLAITDTTRDILKLAVVNRYSDTPIALGFIKGFGLKEGAIASSVGHDSHNITAVGVDDESLCRAVNLIIDQKGGLAAVWNQHEMILPLPVAGLMSNQDGYDVARKYTLLDQLSKDMGSDLRAPFMTLSFMALLVIPSLKLSDKGLFDADNFEFIDLFK